MSDVRDALGHEQDDPVDEYDQDEAGEILQAAHRWNDQARQWAMAYGDPDFQTQIYERQAEAVRDFASWLRAFIDAQVERKLADTEARFASALDRAIQRHRDTEWHR